MNGQNLEALIERIAGMDRPALVDTLQNLNCDFRIDFTAEFLDSISLERLRHIVLAASLHDHQVKATCA